MRRSRASWLATIADVSNLPAIRSGPPILQGSPLGVRLPRAPCRSADTNGGQLAGSISSFACDFTQFVMALVLQSVKPHVASLLGPGLRLSPGDARLDLTDLYAFPSPGNPGKSMFIMNVHPAVGVNPQGPTTAEPFAPGAVYELKIDLNGDSVADLAYRVLFSSSESGTQSATLRRVEGAEAAGMGNDGRTVLEGVPVSTGRDARITDQGITDSSRAGAAIPFSSTRSAPSTTSRNTDCEGSAPRSAWIQVPPTLSRVRCHMR